MALILASDVVPSIVGAMAQHRASSEIQAKGCSALACIANSDTMLDEADGAPGCEAIVAQNGLECLAAAMIALKDDASQLLEVFSLVGLIGFELSECHEMLIRSGALGSVVTFTRQHLDVDSLAAEASATLEGLADGDARTCTELVEQGAIALLIDLMKCHVDHVDVVTNACGALWNLAFGSNHSCEVMVTEGAMQALIACIRAHPDSAVIQAKACGAMWNAANGDYRACDVIIKVGGVRDIKAAMAMHPTDPHLMGNAEGIMLHLKMR